MVSPILRYSALSAYIDSMPGRTALVSCSRLFGPVIIVLYVLNELAVLSMIRVPCFLKLPALFMVIALASFAKARVSCRFMVPYLFRGVPAEMADRLVIPR